MRFIVIIEGVIRSTTCDQVIIEGVIRSTTCDQLKPPPGCLLKEIFHFIYDLNVNCPPSFQLAIHIIKLTNSSIQPCNILL